MITTIIELWFVAAAQQLWEDYVGIPDHHLWALAVIRGGRAS